MTDEFVVSALALGAEMEKDDSQVAKWLVGKARREAIRATQAMLSVPPDHADAIREMQWEVRKYSDLIEWIREAIAETRNAFDQLDDAEKEAVLEEMYPDELTNDA